MSLDDKKEEAEAILDSAEMLLETFGETSPAASDLRKKVAELESELQEPESEKKLEELIDEVRELMDELQDQPIEEDPVDELGPEEEMGMGPEDDVPPF